MPGQHDNIPAAVLGALRNDLPRVFWLAPLATSSGKRVSRAHDASDDDDSSSGDSRAVKRSRRADAASSSCTFEQCLHGHMEKIACDEGLARVSIESVRALGAAVEERMSQLLEQLVAFSRHRHDRRRLTLTSLQPADQDLAFAASSSSPPDLVADKESRQIDAFDVHLLFQADPSLPRALLHCSPNNDDGEK